MMAALCLVCSAKLASAFTAPNFNNNSKKSQRNEIRSLSGFWFPDYLGCGHPDGIQEGTGSWHDVFVKFEAYSTPPRIRAIAAA
jgi:hypothetical protein